MGVFSTLATAILMAVLGVAIGLSALDAHNTAPVLSIGASVWGIVTVGVSFFLGGWMAGRTSGVTDTFSQLLHGVLVWIVTVPLTVYLFAAGVGDLLVATASDVVNLSPPDGLNEPLTTAITPEKIEQTAAQVGHSAWNILSTLLFGFAAAGFGGFIGNRQERLYENRPPGAPGEK